MKRILITGSEGFIGRNLAQALSRNQEFKLLKYDLGCDHNQLIKDINQADVIFHLAGVNRPEKVEEFQRVNVGFTRELISLIDNLGKKPLLIFTSSIQAGFDNPYGVSKKKAEEVLSAWAQEREIPVVIYRLPNVFGKWCRPNYNSAVATFCHNIACGLEVYISDPEREVNLVYIDDVVKSFIGLINHSLPPGASYLQIEPVFKIKLGKIVNLLKEFKESRSSLMIPDFSDPFVKCLYATYLSYLPENDFAYSVAIKEDNRGKLAEILKSLSFGQVFVSKTKPGITRGNHYHETKVEKFCVIEGEAIIRFRHIQSNEIISYHVSGDEIKIVDIPPGYTHSIENIGQKDLTVIFWASEVYDPENPDTYFLEVMK